MNCDKCQREVFLPFKCPYCGGYFCSEHRLPENHQCPQMEMARIPKEELPQVVVQRPGSYEYTISYGPSQKRKGQIYFSEKEVSHLAVATILVIGVGLSLIGFQNLLSSNLLVPAVTTAIFTASFLIHEIGHKITAQKRGLWAEFRLTVMGAVLTLISVISPFFKVISPGAVMIAGYADRQSLGKISIAGPSTNLVLSAVFFTVAAFSWQNPLVWFICVVGAAFNAWISLFNLIPFGIFDGFKIFLWNKLVWAAAFSASVILTVASTYLIS